MSNPYLPPELLDYIVDSLHDDPNALKKCCLVSKSWVPRTRKHLFAEVEFSTEERLESGKKSFPDPSTSPFRFARSLRVTHAHVIKAAGAETGGWLRGFSRIVHLGVETRDMYFGNSETVVSLTPFHGFAQTVKSLRVGSVFFSPSRIFYLILSFPLLEDLAVTNYNPSEVDGGSDSGGSSAAVWSSNIPVFTGTLELRLRDGLRPIAGWLLSLPGGVHFRKLTLTWFCGEDIQLTTALVGECSHTLESLDIICGLRAESISTSVDLSEATKLKVVTFRTDSWDIDWIAIALRTITQKHQDLREISILPASYALMVMLVAGVRRIVREKGVIGQWLELDRLLVQVWKSRPISLKVLYEVMPREGENMKSLVEWLLPGATGGGMIDLVNDW